MELPPPVAAQEASKSAEKPPVELLGTERNPELLPKPSGAGSPPPTSQQTAALGQAAQAVATSTPVPAQATHTSGTPAIADDIDLIEKEWVEKAKTIVNQTKDDPYKQNKAINKMKADYIKKRYNKDIQVSE